MNYGLITHCFDDNCNPNSWETKISAMVVIIIIEFDNYINFMMITLKCR